MSGGQTPSQSNSYQTQQTTNTSEPSPFLQPYLKQLVGNVGNLLDKNPNAPAYYPGQTVATPSLATQSYQQTLRDLGTNGLGYGIDAASRQNAADTLAGKYLDPANNPWLQKSLAAGFGTQNEQFNNTVLPSLRSQFAAAGRTGASEDFDTTMRAAKDLGQTQANAAANAELGAYNNERGIQQQVQGMLPSFQGMDLARASALGQSGQGIDAYNQALIDDQIKRYTYDKTANLNYWSDIAQRMLGMYPGGTTSGTGTSSGYTQSIQGGNPLMSALGMGMQGVGMLLPFLPGFGASDERLKTDIRPVGRLNDGQNVYSYRLRGSPRTEIGLLAQEVEKEHPDAVAMHPAGFKMVHYGRATAHAAPGGLM